MQLAGFNYRFILPTSGKTKTPVPTYYVIHMNVDGSCVRSKIASRGVGCIYCISINHHHTTNRYIPNSTVEVIHHLLPMYKTNKNNKPHKTRNLSHCRYLLTILKHILHQHRIYIIPHPQISSYH